MPGPQKVVNLQGRDYSTWANTLDTAHEKNQSELTRFLGIETTVLQMPGEQNGYTTIVHARAAWLNADGDRVTFDGIGDANPQSVKSMVAAHAIRFAETRAKGRALRDSVNIGEVLEEELGDEEPAPRPSAPRPVQRPSQAPPQTAAAPITADSWLEATLKAKEKLAGKQPPYPAVMADWLRVHIGRGQELVPGILRTEPALMVDDVLALNLDTLEQAILRQQAASTTQPTVGV